MFRHMDRLWYLNHHIIHILCILLLFIQHPPTAITSVHGSTAGSVWQGQSVARDGRGMGVIPGQQQTKMQTTQGATIGHSSDCVVPTLATLRNSADIQAQVNARLQELEQANRTNTAGTGDSTMVVSDLSKKVTVGSKGGNIRRFLLPDPKIWLLSELSGRDLNMRTLLKHNGCYASSVLHKRKITQSLGPTCMNI